MEGLKLFTPTTYVKDVFEVTPSRLREKGIQAVITDLDNTLIEWNRSFATDAINEWIRTLQQEGFQVVIMSNNNEERVQKFCEPLGLTYFARANKPLQSAYKEARKLFNVPDEAIVCIGDQIMTDIIGANRAGLQSILVLPVTQSDAKATKFNRFVESKIMARLKKKGLQVKEGSLWNN